ncbi:MAG: DNA-processing protein DprA [Clostridia bacterium]|nr:DNA-processing protein DprA [Clostridia bacterium]
MEDEQLLYAIWINQACGHNPSLVHRLLKKFQTPEAVYRANHFDSDFYKTLGLGNLLKLSRNLDGAKRLLENCRKKEIQIIDWEDERYPEQLRHIFEPPLLLYAKGKLPDMNRMLGISMVGTRRATKDGEEVAGILARNLAENGMVIISGMAKGIDGAAHCGALEAGGTTLAILAGGVDVIYPSEHTHLYQHILEHGGVLSEQPPGTIGKPYFYKQRNRILVGLAQGTIIVEGELKSGTSLSARLATENNRDIFAVPGNPINKAAELPNALIRDGAKQVTGPLDVLEEYLALYPEQLAYGISLIGKPVVGKVEQLLAPTPAPKKEEKPSEQEREYQLTKILEKGEFREEEQTILRYLCQKGEWVSFDDLAEHCGLEVGKLSSMLIILQMKKALRQQAGGQYQFYFDIEKYS